MWQFTRHQRIKKEFPMVKEGDIVATEIGWWKSFALMPHKTISGRYVWLCPIYKRKVWVYTGFVDEPVTQYGDVFDMLRTK